jgi:hypothetical protein
MSGGKKRTTPDVRTLGVGHWREKRGTVNWVACGACAAWFPVDARLTREVAAGRSYFHCPHCQNEFEYEGARELVRVPST